MLTTLLTFAIILKGGEATLETDIEIQTLEARGVLFEEIGKAKLYRRTVQIVTTVPHIDWTPIFSFVAQSQAAVETLCGLKSKFETNSTNECHQWETELDGMTRQLHRQIEQLDSWETVHREKRGLVNFVGKISKFLFGTMDDGDADEIYSRLTKLEQNDGSSFEVLKRGISILKSNAIVSQEIIGNLSTQEEEILRRIDRLEQTVETKLAQVDQNLKTVQLQTEINHIVLLIMTKLGQINKYLNEHFDMLDSVHRHHLHPLIISNVELINLLKKHHPMLSKESWILRPATIGQVAEVETTTIPTGILIKIELPIPEEETFTINRNYPLPIQQTTKAYTIIEMEEAYLLNASTKFLKMEEETFNKQCQRLKSMNEPSQFLCRQRQPLIIAADPSDCLLNLFQNPFRDPPQCNHRVGTGKLNYIIKLIHPNAWLFAFEEERTLITHCQQNTHTTQLKNIGVLVLKRDCSFQLQNFILPFDIQYQATIKTIQPSAYDIPAINFNRTILKLAESITKPSNKTKPLTKINTHENLRKVFSLNTKSFDELEKEIEDLQHRKHIEKSAYRQNLTSYIGWPTIILLLLAAVVYLKCCRKPVQLTPFVRQPTILNVQSTPAMTADSRVSIDEPTQKINNKEQLRVHEALISSTDRKVIKQTAIIPTSIRVL